MKKFFTKSLIHCLFLFGYITFGLAQTAKIPEKPSFIPPVIDSLKILSSQEYQLLSDKLKKYIQ